MSRDIDTLLDRAGAPLVWASSAYVALVGLALAWVLM